MTGVMNQALSVGTLLQGQAYTYQIEKVLGQGAFGITYLAYTVIKGPLGEVRVPVALKEFFAKDFDSRQSDETVTPRAEESFANKYAQAFRKESEKLSKLKHPGIVNVLEAFEAKGTYYYSMEYLSGGSLDEKVKDVGMKETDALAIIDKVGEALSYMHESKMLHLDLKPRNIMLKADGTPVIIDFGLSKQYDSAGEPESSSTIGLGTPGYAPVEQAALVPSHEFQPTLDVYAIGATLYKMLTGVTPPPATLLLNKKTDIVSVLRQKGVSDSTIYAISKAMCPLMDGRPQSVGQFLSMLGDVDEELTGEEVTLGQSVLHPKEPTGPHPSSDEASFGVSKSKWWLWVLLGGIVALIPTILFLNGLSREPEPGPNTDTDTTLIHDIVPPAEISVQTVSPVVPTQKPKPEPTPLPQDSSSSEDQPSSPPEQDNQPPAADAEPLIGQENGHEWVDLGLSVKWATCNVGASSPGDTGSYFAWGEIDTKSDYSWETYLFRTSGDSYGNVTLSKYNGDSKRGPVDNKKRLSFSDDAARQKFGGQWRMPSEYEKDELVQKCDWVWGTLNGGNGYKVTSRINGNSIFLPAAGAQMESGLSDVGTNGYYWVASRNGSSSTDAWCLHFRPDNTISGASFCRNYGFSIRPVIK